MFAASLRSPAGSPAALVTRLLLVSALAVTALHMAPPAHSADTLLVEGPDAAPAEPLRVETAPSATPPAADAEAACVDGAHCDDGIVCTFGDKCTRGECRGTRYTCNDGRECTRDECDGNGGCRTLLADGSCLINGVCVEAASSHPRDPCRACDPGSSTHTWSTSFDQDCPGGTCNAGRCTAYLVIRKMGEGAGDVTSPGLRCGERCSRGYRPGETVSLAAAAEPGSWFIGWAGPCEGDGVCEVEVRDVTEVRAIFERVPDAAADSVPQFEVSVARTGQGVIKSHPSGVRCGRTCRGRFDAGALLGLWAEPAEGFTFAGWSGACSGQPSQCSLELQGSARVGARFVRSGTARGRVELQ